MCHSLVTVAEHPDRWRPRTVGDDVAAFALTVVGACGPLRGERRKNLLWASAQLGAFSLSVGLALEPGVVFSEAAIERFVVVGTSGFSEATRRTLRTNLRFVARHQGPYRQPVALVRQRSKAPYTDAEIAAYLALADAQPTEARRQRAGGLISLGAGAGLTGVDLRAVRGSDVIERSGGVVVVVEGRRRRVVPVLAPYAPRALAAGRFAHDGYIVGGVEPTRRNITTSLIASLSGGHDLGRLELARLRATWLATVAERIGLPTLMAAAGITCSQRLGDVVGTLATLEETAAVALLGGAC